MQKLVRTSAWLMAVLLAIGMIGLVGCGDDDDDDDDDVTATLTATNPADGSDVAAGSQVSLTFDADPGAVTVNGAAAAGSGNTRTFTVPEADAGQSKQYAISWDGGSATITLNVGEVDNTPPEFLGSEPVEDGDEDVDFEAVGEIRLMFSEPLDKTKSRAVTISPDGGDALDWGVSWEDDDATIVLTPGRGADLSAETTYVVRAASPTDKAGNSIDDVEFTFTTRAKE